MISRLKRLESIHKQTILLGIFKAFDLLISFAITRMVFSYIDNTTLYGVWLTILSILNWFNLADFGIGNGLRNNLTDLLARKKINEAREMVSTAYYLLFKAVVIGIIIISTIQLFLDWDEIFNIRDEVISNRSIKLLFSIMIPAFFLRLWLSTINAVAYAEQDAALGIIIQLISNIMVLTAILLLPYLVDWNKLFLLGIVYSVSYIVVGILVNMFLFKKRYAAIRPSIKYVRKSFRSRLMGLSMRFFIIQIAGVVIFTTDNIIITQVLGASEVVSYQLTYKVFSITTIVAGIILTPVWSAFTHAYVIEDINFITKTLRRLISYMIPLLAAVILLIFISPYLVHIWIGQEINISLSLRLFMGLFVLVSTWNNIFAYFLNGVNKINLQLATSMAGALVNIPISVALAHIFGNSGVILGTSISLLPFTFIGAIQTYYVVKEMKINRLMRDTTANGEHG